MKKNRLKWTRLLLAAEDMPKREYNRKLLKLLKDEVKNKQLRLKRLKKIT